jgi:DNA-binding beta-propeller fold protein YncE
MIRQIRFLALLGAAFLMLTSSYAASSATHGKGLLLIANKGDHTLGIIDPVLGKQVATVDEEGVTGHEVAATPDGKFAVVPIYGNSGVGKAGTDGDIIRVMDIAQRKTIHTIKFDEGVRPHCAVFGPKDHLLYVTTELKNSITVIDPTTWKIVGSIPTGQPEAHMLAISSDGKRGYTANVASGTVSVLDIPGRKLLTTIQVCPKTQRIAVSTDDHWVFTADQTKPRLAVIDAHKNEVAQWVDLEALAYGTATTPDGKHLLVTLPKPAKVAVLDLKTMQITSSIEVSKAPQEIVVQPDGAYAYVSCDASEQVAVIDCKQWKREKYIQAGKGADGLAWAR